MSLKNVAKEFEFDGCVRNLSERTQNYQKQISYAIALLKRECAIESLEEVTPYHIKDFLNAHQKKD